MTLLGPSTIPQLVERVSESRATSLSQEQFVLTIATGLQHGFVAAVQLQAPGEQKVKVKPHSVKYEVCARV